MRRRDAIAAIAGAILGCLVRSAPGEAPGLRIIVHPDNPIGSIDRDLVRRIYLKKVVSWSDGGGIAPIDLPRSHAARDRFDRDVLKKTAAQLRSYWSQQVFSGKATPPREVASVAAAIASVRSDPHAIAYLPDDADPGGAKVIEMQ